MKTKYILLLIILFSAFTIGARLFPHPANIAPVASLMLFAGFLAPKKYALLPILALSISDILIGAYTTGVMVAVYVSYASMLTCGFALAKRYSLNTVLGASIGSAVLFYLVTNAAVWQFTALYPHTASGLLASYTAGIPFFRNTLIGHVLFSGVFFGVYEIARAIQPILRAQKTSKALTKA